MGKTFFGGKRVFLFFFFFLTSFHNLVYKPTGCFSLAAVLYEGSLATEHENKGLSLQQTQRASQRQQPNRSMLSQLCR